MAEENEQAQEGQATAPEAPVKHKRTEKQEKIISASIVGGIVLVFALAGFFLGKVLVETLRPEPIVAAQVAGMMGAQQTAGSGTEEDIVETEKTWFYNLEPVVANLDEPGATRYVRTTLTLEIYNSLSKKDGTELLEEKAPHMRNWLAIYLASLSLDDARGERNLKRIQSQVLEEFNQILFPNAQPLIGRILLKDFAIQ